MVERTEANLSFEAIRLEKLFLNSPELLIESLAEDMDWDPVKQVFRFPENPHRLIDINSDVRQRRICLADSSNGPWFNLMKIVAFPSNNDPWKYSISVDAWKVSENGYWDTRYTMKVADRLKSPYISERFIGPITAHHHEHSYSFPDGDVTLRENAGFDTVLSSDRADLEQYLLENYGDISPHYLSWQLPTQIDGFATMRNFFDHLTKRDPSAPLLVPERPKELA